MFVGLLRKFAGSAVATVATKRQARSVSFRPVTKSANIVRRIKGFVSLGFQYQSNFLKLPLALKTSRLVAIRRWNADMWGASGIPNGRHLARLTTSS